MITCRWSAKHPANDLANLVRTTFALQSSFHYAWTIEIFSKICFQIATIQSMVHRLLNKDDSESGLSVDQYDCIVVDECHRGYNFDQELSENELRFRDEADYISKYARVIEYFDAVKIGLTATPALHTIEIFGGES